MRLTGSLTEKHAKDQLEALQRGFASHPQFERMMKVIKERVPDAVSARAFRWFPDDGDDVFTILVDDTHLIQIEAPQQPRTEPEVLSIAGTARGLKRQDQIKLAVALKLIPEAKF